MPARLFLPGSARPRSAVLAAVAAVGTAALAAATLTVGPLAPPAEAASNGMFKVKCGYSHTLSDDPIVFPRQAGAAHAHDFTGATTTNAGSTVETLRRSPTTCTNAADKSAYWAPQLFANGRAVRPPEMQVYYRGSNPNAGAIRPFPMGLRIVAGDSKATGPQPVGVLGWTCSNGGLPNFQSTLRTCVGDEKMRNRIRFPECWDGVHLDSPDHKGHMAYLAGSRCPASHPVALPRLDIEVHYGNLTGVAPSAVSLSSGPWWTSHADFINAWTPSVQAGFVRTCLNSPRKCDVV
jgi:hypothetical protein